MYYKIINMWKHNRFSFLEISWNINIDKKKKVGDPKLMVVIVLFGFGLALFNVIEEK